MDLKERNLTARLCPGSDNRDREEWDREGPARDPGRGPPPWPGPGAVESDLGSDSGFKLRNASAAPTQTPSRARAPLAATGNRDGEE